MNYISEINRFYDWLETNPVSDSSIILWHALMHINNKTGWRAEFTVAISTLEHKTALSKSSILRARKNLQDTGRIKVQSRDGQQSAIYSLVAFHTDTQTGTQSEPQVKFEVQTGTQSEPQSGTQTVPISKLKETKQIQYIFDSEEFKKSFDDFVKFRKEKKKPLTGQSLEKQMQFLGKYSESVAIAIIEKSIRNGWQGLFEPKDLPAESAPKKTYPQDLENTW